MDKQTHQTTTKAKQDQVDCRPEVVVVGAGWAGCAAAVGASWAGARVTLVERSDMLLGTGLVGGIMCNNGRLTALEELRALGAADLVKTIEAAFIHRNVEFPGHKHASLYDVCKIEPLVRKLLITNGVRLLTRTRCTDALVRGNRLERIVLSTGRELPGDCFVDATGSAGPASNCQKRSGCVGCVLRCFIFGPRTSLAEKAGVAEITTAGTHSASGSCKLLLSSLSADLVHRLLQTGMVQVPLPAEVRLPVGVEEKSCRQYDDERFKRSIILLHTGEVKMMVPYIPLEQLRLVPGLENARYLDPAAGSMGNSVRYNVITPHDETLRVEGLENLYCAGEKTGLVVGHTEALATGLLAGHNATRAALGLKPVTWPKELMVGDFLHYVQVAVQEEKNWQDRYTFSGSVYFFNSALKKGLYSTNIAETHRRVHRLGLQDTLARPLT